MGVVFTIVLGLLAASALLVVVRLLRGPGALDRIVAVDVLVVLLVAGTAVQIAMTGRGGNIALLVAVALLAFVSSMTAARLAKEREL
ncbi:monovalent cation/H+ antiporter complex subunit F [Streptoalloteichus hindustanus]|uniref:Multisubunit sodium/proton antiporter, MrpF subunit n=1 Tax=Streptoalloteichus hindustanus TaxID=2017 RepID=A0A1M5P727_STRHI|nr:monovalent cation/H+ antiporter complex subunit F [Streptoalloteichus hindustanus]SHG97552.1 multisubunit sodium/proton antiporter, MrpF subunit [Streptoalloteichus hindustanus]